MTTKDLLKELRKRIIKEAGSRCKSYSNFCFTCGMWRIYDALKEFLEDVD